MYERILYFFPLHRGDCSKIDGWMDGEWFVYLSTCTDDHPSKLSTLSIIWLFIVEKKEDIVMLLWLR